jgi:uncharacterized protein
MNSTITTVVKRTPIMGREKECLEWLKYVGNQAHNFKGHLGFEIFQNTSSSNLEYILQFKFDTQNNLSIWENSVEKSQALDKGKNLFEQNSLSKQVLTGIEYLFETEKGSQNPPRYKMVLVTIVVIFILSNILSPVVGLLLPNFSSQIKSLVGITLSVLLMTYLIMPNLIRVLHRWLYHSQSK